MTRSFTLRPLGDFSLRESALFGFGQREAAASYDGVMRLAFCLDGGYEQQVGVELRQRGDVVEGVLHGEGDGAAAERQVARMLSLDHDARGFADVGRRDPVLRRLQVAAPGLRPPLFHSAYEAAMWSVLSARRPGVQMARVRTALSDRAGRRFTLAGQRVAALPTPSAVLRLGAFPGIDADRLERMQGVARAAADGLLDTERLRALGAEAAAVEVQRLKGIGPFYADLIVVRALGLTDVLAAEEPMAQELVGALYGLAGPATPQEYARIAEPWAPWRTWASVYVRAVGPRVLATSRLSA